ncbi:Hypothetical protein D9617_7g030590 [Elsinoe fawcettii]|nr:Hypothetical protein D9617_7g030590 [Elsinoe fawcettii]
MSAVEVAGLILAAIPLVVSALEHYDDIMDSTTAFFRFQGELGRITRRLRNLLDSFEQSLLVLLTPITAVSDRRDMLDNTNSPIWQDAGIDRLLRDHLQGSYLSYMRTVKDIERVITAIADKIENIHGAQQLSRGGLKALVSHNVPAKVQGKTQDFDFSKALKFTMSKRKLVKLSEELMESIDFLDTFQHKADKIGAIDHLKTTSGRHSKLILHADAVRDNAEKLYSALSNTFCSSHTSHATGLLLELKFTKKSRRGDPEWQLKNVKPQICDASCFGLSVSQKPTQSLNSWLDLEVRLASTVAAELPQKTTVQWSVDAPTKDTVTAPPPYEDVEKLQVVTDICSALSTRGHSCVGFCVDEKGCLRGGYDAQREVAYAVRETSLQEILQRQPGTLRHLERYHLAIALTVALLQLSHTSWLKQSWNKASIMFLRARSTQSKFGPAVDVSHPYLVREHELQTALATTSNGAPTDSSKIAALGIMLLEVCEGVPIEAYIEAEDVGPKGQANEMSYMAAARRYLSQDPTEGISQYAFGRAIEYCLKCFWEPRASLADPVFAKTLEENVLVPLEQEMNIIRYGPAVM